MHLEDIKLFVWVAQLESFSLAAKHFELPRQTVSRRIQSLEKQLGVRLLHRTTRHIELTDLGQEFLERWVVLLQEIEYTNQVISDRQRKPSGKVTIACTNEIARVLLGEWLPEFVARYPDIELMLHSTEGTGQQPDLNLDLLFHIGRPKDSSFIGISLGCVYRKFYASPAFIERHGKPLHPSELGDFPCIRKPMPGEPENIWQWYDARGAHDVTVSGPLGADTSSFAQAMAEKGLGVACLPEFLVRDSLKNGTLVTLFDGLYGKPYEIFVLYATRNFVPAKNQVVIDFIKEKLVGNLDLAVLDLEQAG